MGAGFVDILTDGHLHSVCAGSCGGCGDQHGAADGGGRGSRGGGRVGRHLMSSCRHRPRWRASQRGRWRRQWWRGLAGERWVGDSAGGAAGNDTAPWRSRRWWSVELHAQAAAGTLRAVVASEAPLRAVLLRRGAAGRCGSPGEAARPWRRLRPRECCGGHGGTEARAGGRAAAAQLSAPARALYPGAAVQRPRGGGKGNWCADCGQRRRFPQPTALPLPSHHRLPSPPRLPTLPRDPLPPAAGVQDGLRLQRQLLSAQCCGWWRTQCARWPLELQSGRSREGTTSRRGLKPVYIIHILETHKISESVACMKDTGC
jgi:hypothetical protein